jgi:hypothetical protein
LEKDRLEDDNGDDDIELDRMYTGFVVYAAPEYTMTGISILFKPISESYYCILLSPG